MKTDNCTWLLPVGRIAIPVVLVLIMSLSMKAQTDTIKPISLDSVFIMARKSHLSSFDQIHINVTQLRQSGASTLAAALAGLPGVSSINTGSMSRPVIRGLTADRIQINIGGIRYEDQQWEDEYGLGLTSEGAENISIIKGPASLLYGSGAMGGVIRIGNEIMPEKGNKEQAMNMKIASNSLGLDLNYSYKKSGKNNFLLEAGIVSHGDYTNGSGQLVPNTRYGMYHFTAGYDINRKKFSSENRIRISFNQFGFVADSADLLEEKSESSFDREFEDAHLSVFSFIGTSTNTYRVNSHTTWKMELGLQTNSREEMERSEEVEMSMLLSTASLQLSLEKDLSAGWKWTNGMSGMIQSNHNFEDRIIVPNATIGEGSIFTYLSKLQTGNKILGMFEAGLRYDVRSINTLPSKSEEAPAADFPVFSRNLGNLNGSIGESLTFRSLTVKLNISSGFRSGNLAELAANGLHEGTSEWFLGDPHLKLERCLNEDLSLNWSKKWFSVHGSVYHNRFFDYIYLRPTNDKINDFKLFRYEQTNASFTGFEGGITFEKAKLFLVSFNYSHLDAKRDDGSWLPYMPADRFNGDGKYYLPPIIENLKELFISLGTTYCLKQDQLDQAELLTPAYFLMNTGIGCRIHSMKINLICRNITNQLYFDHLSRLKYYGLYDMGRNIIIGINWKF